MVITSTQNERLKNYRFIQTKKGRKQTGLFSAEGVNILKDIPNNYPVEELFIRESDYDKFCFLEEKLGTRATLVLDKIFDTMCDTTSPMGAAATFKLPSQKKPSGDIILLLSALSDAGNVGTAIRTAAAKGVETVLTYGNCADCFSPKAVRASMGGVFHTNVVSVTDRDILHLKKTHTLVSMDMGGTPIKKFIREKPIIIAIGNEAHGLADFIIERSDVFLSIPMSGKVESLNAAVSASLALYLIE